MTDNSRDNSRDKGKAVAVRRTPAQIKKEAERARRAQERAALDERNKQAAQIANLIIAGYSLEQIGTSIGATAEEVDRLLTHEMARFVRTQPALRNFTRNWISEKYLRMIEANYDIAVDKNHKDKLDNQDRTMRMLDRLAKLHGAEAPTQSEVKVEAAPEAVEKMVTMLSARAGTAYDVDIFDAEVIHEAAEATHDALEEREDD